MKDFFNSHRRYRKRSDNGRPGPGLLVIRRVAVEKLFFGPFQVQNALCKLLNYRSTNASTSGVLAVYFSLMNFCAGLVVGLLFGFLIGGIIFSPSKDDLEVLLKHEEDSDKSE